MEDLIIATLQELVDSFKRKNQQGEIPPSEEDLDGDREEFQISDEE